MLSIIITDVNDNAPYFSPNSRELTVDTNMSVGSTVFVVHAYDIDSPGVNSELKYGFLDQYDFQEIKNYLSLNPKTGEIKLVQSLTEMVGDTYTTTIYAQDSGEKPLRGVLKWKLKVNIANRFAPEINFKSAFEKLKNCNIPENGEKYLAVGYFEVTDDDQGHGGHADLELLNNFENFKVTEGNNRFYLRSLASFDFEQQNSYNITVKAHDCRDYTNCDSFVTEYTIELKICDENEHFPIFESEVFQLEVAEEQKGVEPLLQITATDQDPGLNGKILYSIEKSNISRYFSIGQNSGWVSNVEQLDAEMLPELLELEIIVTDQGQVITIPS